MARIQSTLLAAASTLAACASTSELLQRACETVVPHLGFERAAVYRRGERPELLLLATRGWESRELLSSTLSVKQVDSLLVSADEQFGCWLLDAHQLFSVSPYDRERSRRNGRGAAAWGDDCLVVPIRDATGSLSGLIVVEDPID
jgi:GAF domain-containing protein